MESVVSGIQSVSFHVRDIQKARHFYGKVLGLKELQWLEGMQMAVFAVPGAAPLSMHPQAPGEPGRPAGGVTGIIFETADLQRAHDEIRKRGGDVVDPIEKRPWGASYFTVADPDGNEFLFTSRG